MAGWSYLLSALSPVCLRGTNEREFKYGIWQIEGWLARAAVVGNGDPTTITAGGYFGLDPERALWSAVAEYLDKVGRL